MAIENQSSAPEENAAHLRKWVTALGIKGLDQLFKQSEELEIPPERFGSALEAYVIDFIDRNAEKLKPLVVGGILEKPRKRRAAEQRAAAAIDKSGELNERQRKQLGGHALDEKGRQYVFGQGIEGKTFFAAAEHCIFGSMLVEMIGERLGWEDQDVQDALHAFLLHDAAKPLETQLRDDATKAGESSSYGQQCSLLWEAYEQCGGIADKQFREMGISEKVISLAHANDFRKPNGQPFADIWEMSEQERVVAFMDQMIRDTMIVSVDERIGNARRKGPENVWVKLARGGEQQYPGYNRDLEQQKKALEIQAWLHSDILEGVGARGELPFKLQEMFVARIMAHSESAPEISATASTSKTKKALHALFGGGGSEKE